MFSDLLSCSIKTLSHVIQPYTFLTNSPDVFGGRVTDDIVCDLS